MTFDIIRRNYARRLWHESDVAIAVRKGLITQSQFEEIVSESRDTEEVAMQDHASHNTEARI